MATRKTTKATKTKNAANTKPLIIKVVAQPEKPYRPNTARDLYWQVINQYQGKPLNELVATLENPKTCPKVSPKRGTPEPGNGWVQYFVRQGLVQVTQ